MKSMGRISLLIVCFVVFSRNVLAQDIVLDRQGGMEQACLDSYESTGLLPMNELNMEFGYVLYESQINVESEKALLELEHVRDYAVAFVDDKLQGTLTDHRKSVSLNVAPGKYKLRLFVENIGRITYGPEILDNSRGLFGRITLADEDIEHWKMTPLDIKGIAIAKLTFEERKPGVFPCFLKGEFHMDHIRDCYLDLSGWGMGEVWVNGKYAGAFWEEEKQQSIQVAADMFIKGKNEIVVFELKNTEQKTMKITYQPVFH